METSETLALTESETARRLGVSISGLRKWRRNGSGPRFVRLGRLVRYLATDIQVWLDKHCIDPEQRRTEM
jgi:predicted DNA-binding transcriptional regulator AlpA